MKKLIYTPLLLLFMLSCSNGHIKIEWANHLEGDYSFTEKWEYTHPMSMNEFGQLVFAGREIGPFLDENGRIRENLINEYYRAWDTTHIHHTIQHISPQNDNTDNGYVNIDTLENDTLLLYLPNRFARQWTINMRIKDDICITEIHYTPSGIDGDTDTTMLCKEGTIHIDKKLWKEGTMKAYYKFKFSEEKIWEGKIYKSIR